MSRTRWPVLLAATAVFALAGCSDDTAAPAAPAGPITTTTSPPTVPPSSQPSVSGTTPTSEPSDPNARLVGRLKAVDPSRLKLGTEFNRQFLSMYLQSVGFDQVAAQCIVERVAAGNGAAFSDWTMTQLFGGLTSLNAQTVGQCVPADRLAAISKQMSAPNFAKAPPQLVRSVIAELATSDFEAGGLTAPEATCLADAMVAKMPDDKMASILTAPSFDDRLIADALPTCVEPERIAVLAG